MKKRHLVLLGVAAFLTTLIVRFPAASLLSWVKTGNVNIAQVSGSVWNGSAGQIQLPDAENIENVNWSFNPLGLLTAQAGADLDFTYLGGHASMTAAYGVTGNISLSDGQYSVAAKALEALLPLPLAEFRGELQLNLAELVIAGQQLKTAQGALVWKGAKLVRPVAAQLGTVELDVKPDGKKHIFTLNNKGGEVRLSGQVILEADNRYKADIKIKPERNASRELTSSLQMLGRKKKDGSYRIQQQGRLSELL